MNLLSLFETFNNEIQAQEDNLNDAINDISYIQFEDPEVERICHEQLHVYTYEDAKKIIELNAESGFYKSNITSFNELKYFINLKKIEKYTFYNCNSLQQINIPNSVTEIGPDAFKDCNSLQQINIPNGVTKIKNYTFCNCNSLQQINIPNGVTEIGSCAFMSCNSLQQINIPNSVTKIKDYTFYNCESLQQINIPNGVTKIKDYTFCNCNSLQQINIPNSVTEIGPNAFMGCNSLQQINIPNGVTEIGSCAFKGCKSLQQINIPNSVTEIAYYAFWNCESLQQINIPNSVTEIGPGAFERCENLKTIYVSKKNYEKFKNWDFGKLLKIKNNSNLVNETFNNEIQAQEDNIDDAINKISYPYLNNQMVIDYLPYLAYSVKHINKIMDPGYNSYNIDNFNKVNKIISNFDIPKLERAIKDVTTIINQGNYQKAKSYIDEYTLYGGLYVDKDFLNQEEDMDNCMDLHHQFGIYANPNFTETDAIDYENLEDIEDKESQKKYVIAFLNFLYTVLFVLLGYQTYINNIINNIFKFLHNELDLKKAYQLGYNNFIQ